jgi:hypothetical protein
MVGRVNALARGVGRPGLAAAGVTSVLVTVFLLGSYSVQLAVLAFLAAVVAAYVAAVHPAGIFRAFAVFLGFAPYVDLPGTRIHMVLVLSLGIWVALAFMPMVDFRPGVPEVALGVIAVLAVVSMVATGVSSDSIEEVVAWLAATSVVTPLRFAPSEVRTSVVRTFVVSAAFGGLVGLGLLVADPQGAFLGRLAVLGYSQTGMNTQYVLSNEALNSRLTGTFVEPNIAGLILAAGTVLAVAYFRGLRRVALVGILGLALLLTLSRSAAGTVVVAAGLVTLWSAGRRRYLLVGAAMGAAALAWLIPSVQDRLLESFGPSDTGTHARSLALQEFPNAMAGHWAWGLGWALEEFRNPSLAQTLNRVANGPLTVVYRSGIVLGIVFTGLLLLLAIRAFRLRKRSFADATVAALVLGMVLVAWQLDFPLVLEAPATALFSMIAALSLHRDEVLLPDA